MASGASSAFAGSRMPALRDAAGGMPVDPGWIAVNLGMAQFRCQSLATSINRILDETGMPAGRLELEVTESVLMEQHKDAVFETLSRLHQRGVTFALDDFGTGYASLIHRKRLPVHCLKIDQSFVRDIGTDPDDAAIALLDGAS